MPIDSYVKSVRYFIRKHKLSSVNIFLTTEDPHASAAFKSHATVIAKKWKIFEYSAAVSNYGSTHTPALDATSTKGKFGLISMIVLLLSMESQYYVLTTASNWSMLINSLLKGVVMQNVDIDYIDLRHNPLSTKLMMDFNIKSKPQKPKEYPYNSNGVLAFPIGTSID